MTWQHARVAEGSTHHLVDGIPAYPDRFDHVLPFREPGLAPVHRGDVAWHIHLDGSAAYPRRFGRTFGFYEGVAAVAGADGWCHLRPDGEDLYPTRYAWVGNFQGGRCTVRQATGSYLHLRVDGSPAYEARWSYAGDFREGAGVVAAEDGRSTHIDVEGRLVHAHWFDDLDVFHKGFARARDSAGWMHIDRAGVPRYPWRFALVEPFYNGQARVEEANGRRLVIDEVGDTIVELAASVGARRDQVASSSR